MISCVVNFKENFTKNIPYYNLLLKQINDAQSSPKGHKGFICEHAAINCSRRTNVLSKICEGYQFIISFDGDLSNTKGLKNELSALGYCFTSSDDAELALNAYIHFGEKAPSKLDGSFSFVIYDTMRRQIFAASDAFSKVPLFYTKRGELYIFASQIRGIFSHPDILPKISSRGLSELLSFSKGISAEIFENIHMLPPAHILKIKDGECTLKKYPLPPAKEIPDYEDCEQTFLSLLSENLKGILNENSAVLHLGGIKDELLSAISAKIQFKNATRLYEYSTLEQGISKKYSAHHTHIVYDETVLFDSLQKCVDICALPVLSGSDFLLPLIFEKVPKIGGNILTSLPDISVNTASNRKVLSFNNLFHASISETLEADNEKEDYIRINSAHILAETYEINLKSPLLSRDILNFLTLVNIPENELLYNSLRKLCGTDADFVPKSRDLSLSLKLKRILLDTIADDSAPILAFFDKSSLLKLCERGFDLSGGNISETELVSYLIKLNLWFLKYQPVII